MNIRTIKQSLLKFIASLSIAVPITLSSMIVNADSYVPSSIITDVSARVNSSGESQIGGSADIHITNGVLDTRTGYLCYLVNSNGGTYTKNSTVITLYSPGYSQLGGTSNVAVTRTGLKAPDGWTGQADWGCKPFNQVGNNTVTSNESTIKQWFLTKDGGVDNSQMFVQKYWGDEAATDFENDQCKIVIEVLLNLQFNDDSKTTTGTITDAQRNQIVFEAQDVAREYMNNNNKRYRDRNNLYSALRQYNYEDSELDEMTIAQLRSALVSEWAFDARNVLIDELKSSDGGSKTYEFAGPPLLGTIVNLIGSKTATCVCFDKYLYNYVPSVLHIVKDEAGFNTVSTGGKLSDSQVLGMNGVGMMIVSYKRDGQSTCDESIVDAQPVHQAPKESTGSFNGIDVSIVKNYRTKTTKGTEVTYTDDGCTIRNNVSNKILIENEPTYRVIGWAISTNSNPSTIDSINWNPPSQTRAGTLVTTVELDSTIEKTLYVLLEKSDEEEEEVVEEKYNYLLTETQVTRSIKFSEPDDRLDNMTDKIEEWDFAFNRAAHKTKCDGHSYKYGCSGHSVSYTYTDSDGNQQTRTTTETRSDNCKTNYAYCTWGKWTDNKLDFNIENELTASSGTNLDDIVANKGGFEPREVEFGELLKRENQKEEYEDSKGVDEQTWEDYSTNWDYICVLARGQDAVTIAEWKGVGTAVEAVLPSGKFVVSNQPQGTRYQINRGTDTYYYEKFSSEFKLTGDIKTVRDISAEPTYATGYTGSTTKCGPNSKYVGLTTLKFNDITVKVEVYIGKESLADQAISYNRNAQLITSNKEIQKSTASGTRVPTDTISFYPYLHMQYDLHGTANQPVQVLGEYVRSIKTNAYGEVQWDKFTPDGATSGVGTLTVNSTQFSTHAEAAKESFRKGSVLPGGATLTLKVDETNWRKLIVRTYQVILDGDGLKQVEETTGAVPSGMTEADAKSNHDEFVSTVLDSLQNTKINQYVSKDGSITSPIQVTGKGSDTTNLVDESKHESISCLNNGSSVTSKETKYYLQGSQGQSNSPYIDAEISNPTHTVEKCTFYSDDDGNIKMKSLSHGDDVTVLSKAQSSYSQISNTLAKEIDEKTMVVSEFAASIERNHGSDSTNATWATGGTWYNEQFDGFTVIILETEIQVGTWQPNERHTVIDPKLIPKQDKKVNSWSFFSTAWRTDNYSQTWGEGAQEKIGEFLGSTVNFTKYYSLFVSNKVIYIPSATTQDLR